MKTKIERYFWYRLSVIILFIITMPLHSFQQTWERILFPNRKSVPLATEEKYDKGYVTGGYFIGTYGSVKDGYLIKTDVNGNPLWYKTIGQNDGVGISDATNDSDGGLILCGTTHSIEDWDDPIIMKLNPCMEVEWCRIYHTPNPDYGDWGQNIYPLAGGGYIAFITQYGMDEEKCIWLFKLDNNGDLVWQKYYIPTDPLTNDELSYNMVLSNDSSCILSGYCFYPEPGTSIYWLYPYLVKTNIEGDMDWDLIWKDQDPQAITGEAYASNTDNAEIVYTAGYRKRFDNPYGYSPTLYKATPGGQKIDYIDVIPDSENGALMTIDWLQDSTLLMTGGWVYPGNINNAVFKTNRNGDTLKTKVLDTTTLYFAVRGVDITYDNKIIMAAEKYANNMTRTYLYKLNSDLEYDSIYTAPFVYDSLCPHPIPTDTIPLDCVIVGIDEPQKLAKENQLTVFPNPATDKITIVIPDKLVTESKTTLFNVTTVFHQWDKATLEIFDVNGRNIFRKEIPSAQKQVELDVSKWLRGLYLVRLTKGNRPIASSKLLIE